MAGSPISSSSTRVRSEKLARRWRIPSMLRSWFADISLPEIASRDEYRDRSSSLSSISASRTTVAFSSSAPVPSLSRSWEQRCRVAVRFRRRSFQARDGVWSPGDGDRYFFSIILFRLQVQPAWWMRAYRPRRLLLWAAIFRGVNPLTLCCC